MKLYKVLVGGESRHGGNLAWSLPTKSADGSWTPGAWHEVEGDVVLCRNGLHLTPDPEAWWLDGCDVYEVEAEGVVGDLHGGAKKVAAKRARLLCPINVDGIRDAMALRALEIARANEEYFQKLERDRDAAARQEARWKRDREKRRAKEHAELMRVCALTPTQREAERAAGKIAPSNVMVAVNAFWGGISRDSWQRLNAAMASLVHKAVKAGMHFNETDVADLFGTFRAGRWLGIEGLYAEAVNSRNVSAARSIEHYLGRKPFIVEGVRLAVGSAFPWEGVAVKVTSFSDEEDGSLVACAYERGSSVPKRRFTITRAAFRAAFSKKSAAKEAV